MNGVVVAKRDGARRSDGHIEAVAVYDFVEFVLRLEISQLGISQHGKVPGASFDTMIEKHQKKRLFYRRINQLSDFDAMTRENSRSWYRLASWHHTSKLPRKMP
jgi:hypothetical protein